MTIKGLDFTSPFFLAPLAGYTDTAFRRIAHEWGSAAEVTEMVSAEGLARGGQATEALLDRYPGEDRLIVQLFAPDEDPIARCLERLMRHEPAIIDLNCGCPVNKVVRTGAGSALMRTPEVMGRMVKLLVRETALPVSVKFRLGWDRESVNYLDFARIALDNGASMLTLHARTRSQMYSGKADWSAIARLKEATKDSGAAIFASGDILSAHDAVSVMRQTGCDGVMLARGAIGRPFIFKECAALMAGEVWEPSVQERKACLMRHLDYMIEHSGEAVACREMRKHAIGYVKGLAGASRVKAAVNAAMTRADYEEAVSLIG